jgi:uncharacterized protein (TIGR02145 family)
MSRVYIYDGTEWCNTCAGAVKIKVPSGDWIQVDPMTNTTKYFDGTEWVLMDCCCEITIGTQTWQCENLNVATYRNGDVIPQVTDPTEWANLTTGAWCYYDNDPSTEAIYGKLYNWYAVNDPRGIAPTGYHVPSDTEWTTLTDYLGGESVAGGAMKKSGITPWLTPNTDATNSSGFTALPGGFRSSAGGYDSIGAAGFWWSSTEVIHVTGSAWYRMLNNFDGEVVIDGLGKTHGFSVRLIKD